MTINQQNLITNKAVSENNDTEEESNECDEDRIYNCCPGSDMSEGWCSELKIDMGMGIAVIPRLPR